ncbi:MAG: AMP-binding protein [Micrococcales bacterium]|nr:AMP-binding protein [Micrococcales bacterium]MCL2666829.1 AMP-binding protein [Micrococcales bacterium]
MESIAGLLESAGKSDATITFIDGGKASELTYNNLLAVAQETADRLVSDLGPGRQCVIACDQNAAFVKQFWACMIAGWQAVIVPFPSTSQTAALLGAVMAQHPRPVVATSSAAAARALVAAGVGADDLSIDDISFVLPRADRSAAVASPTAPVVQYSSGSTGMPKGVLLSTENVLHTVGVVNDRLAVTPDDCSYTWLPLTHVFSLFGFHVTAVALHANQTIQRTSDFLFDPLSWMDEVSQRRITVTGSPNFGYQHFLRAAAAARQGGQDRAWDLRRLRAVVNGAEDISVELAARFEGALVPFGARRGLIMPAYGMSEATVAVTTAAPGAPIIHQRFGRSSLSIGDRAVLADERGAGTVEIASVGTPLDGLSVRLTDGDGTVADGTVGQIEICGPQVSPGYHADASHSSLTPDGWLQTGDVGVRLDGELYILGRVKDMLVVNGVNYWPDDLENVLVTALPALRGRVAVVAGPNEEEQTEEVVVCVEQGETDPDDLPGEPAIRSAIAAAAGLRVGRVVRVPELPRTQSGKVRRFLVRQSLLPQEPQPASGGDE